MLADFADLIRTSPSAARVLTLFIAYADDKNSIITDAKSIANLLGMGLSEVKYAIRKLVLNGYIEMQEVKVSHTTQIFGVVHDTDTYSKSQYTQWEVIGTKLITDFSITGTYNRFTIDTNIAKCTDNGCGNSLLKHLDGKLFYDRRIPDNEIIWEL